MQDAVIVSATRTAVGRAPNGALKTVRPDEMAATVIAEALRRAPGIEPSDVEDVILGCAMPEAEQGLNVARIASLRAGVPVSASAVTINRFCSSGLQAIAYAGERIMCGFANTILAGGTESMSMVPMGGNKISPNPTLVDNYPDVYLSTGLVAENHARENQLSREEQDAFALRSHQRAIAAIDAGRFADEITPLAYRIVVPHNGNGKQDVRDLTLTVDEGPRRDTSEKALAALRPAFHAAGTVTAGNSSQTSDGASAPAGPRRLPAYALRAPARSRRSLGVGGKPDATTTARRFRRRPCLRRHTSSPFRIATGASASHAPASSSAWRQCIPADVPARLRRRSR